MPTVNTSDSQIAAFLERQPVSADPTQADQPQVIFRGALELDRQQEETLVNAALKWLEDLSGELGRSDSNLDSPDITAQPSLDASGMKFMQQRQLWDMVYNQRFDWRRTLWGGIYAQGQNVHVPLARRGVQQMIARAQNYFFQTAPWFSVTPTGAFDPELATTCNEWAQYRFHKAKVKAVLEKAVELAFIRGETVVKAQHVDKSDYYQTFASIAVDEEGNAILNEKGDYILEDDIITAPPPQVDPATGETVAAESPAPMMFVMQKIRRKIVRYSGPEVSIRNYRDFLCSKNVPDFQSAPCLVDLYDMPAIEIVEQYKARLEERGEWDAEEYPRVMELLKQASSGSRISTNAADQSRPELGEVSGDAAQPSVREDPLVQVGEFHMWYDADNDGTRENLYLLVDLQTKRPILYDYTANVFKGGKRPYANIRINPVDGRWYGVSAIDMLWPLQRFADLTVNRWDLSLSQSGAVTFWSPTLTVQGESNPNLELNGGKNYTKRDPNTPANKIVERVPLYEFKGAQLERILELVIQLVTNLTGTANVNDAAMAGLDTAKLATGVRNMDRSGQEQFAPFLSHLSEGIDDICEQTLGLAVQYMDEQESFSVLGPNGAAVMKLVGSQDLRSLQWSISLEMTRYKSEQEDIQMQSATAVGLEYMGLPPAYQAKLFPLYRGRLRLYGVKDTDSIITMPTEQDFLSYAAAQQAEAAPAKKAGAKPASA